MSDAPATSERRDDACGDSVLVEDRERVRLITLARPAALNAFDASMFDAVRAALCEAEADPTIHCVAITGTGRAFSAGSDLAAGERPRATGGEVETNAATATAANAVTASTAANAANASSVSIAATASHADDRHVRAAGPVPDPYAAFIECVERFPKPMIAAVNGLAVGIGVTMLGHCDIVIASRTARFRVPFASLGLVPEAGSTATLPALLGAQRANHALLSSAWLSAQEAHAGGLVWRLTEADELLERTFETCAEIAAHPLASLVATKRLLLDARLPAASAARAREEPEFRRLLAGPAHQEALRTFRDRKRR